MSILADNLLNFSTGDSLETVTFAQKILEPSNYITGAEAERIHNRLIYKAHKLLGHELYHDWLIIVSPRGGRTFYRGRINENGEWTGRRINQQKRAVKPDLSGADIRAEAKESGNGVWHIPRSPFEVANKRNCYETNVLKTEWDSTDPDPQKWLWVTVLSLFYEYGMPPNSITSSGGKCNGLSPHAEWYFTESMGTLTLLYFQYVMECLGADPATTRSEMQQYRKAGFFRHEEGHEQGLFCDYHDNFYDGNKWIETALKIGKSLGIDILTPNEWHKKRAEDAERKSNDNPIDIDLFNGDDIAQLISEVDNQLPPYSKGGGTYQYRLKILTAFTALVDSKATAMALAPNLTSGASFGSLSGNSSPFGTIVNQVRLLLCDTEWHLPQWFREKYYDDLGKKKREKRPAGYASILPQGIAITGNADDVVKHVLSEMVAGKIPHDNSFTGAGKTHKATINLPPLFKELQKSIPCRVILLHPDPRNVDIQEADFKVLPTRNDNGFIVKNGRKVRADDDDIDTTMEGGYCPYTTVFNKLAAKGIDPFNGGGEPLPCQKCEHKRKCKTTPGWFYRDRDDAIKGGGNLIGHPISFIGLDLSNIATIVVIDEASKSLDITKEIKVTLNDLQSELSGLIQSMENRPNAPYVRVSDSPKPCDADDFFKPVRAVLTALETAINSKESGAKYGIDGEKVCAYFADIDKTNLPQIIDEISLYQDDFGDSIFIENESDSKLIGKGKELSKIETMVGILENRPNKGLKPLLESIMGAKIYPALFASNKDLNRRHLTLTYTDTARLKFLGTAWGVQTMDATGSIPDLEAKLSFLGKPVSPFYHDLHNGKPLSNVNVHVIEVKGISGNEEKSGIGKEKITSILDTIKKSHPNVDPVVFCQKVDRLMEYSKGFTGWLAADGHWGADTVGSNRFAGRQVVSAVGLPLTNLTAYRAYYHPLHGTLDGWEEAHTRATNEGIFQMIGRTRNGRYEKETFDIYIVTPYEWIQRDYSFLEALGATVDHIDVTTFAPVAADSHHKAKDKYEKAVVSLLRKEAKVTQSAVATEAGRSRQALSDFLKNAQISFADWVTAIKRESGFTIESNILLASNTFSDLSSRPIDNSFKGDLTKCETHNQSVICQDDPPQYSPIIDNPTEPEMNSYNWSDIMARIERATVGWDSYRMESVLFSRYRMRWNDDLSLEMNLAARLDDDQLIDFMRWAETAS